MAYTLIEGEEGARVCGRFRSYYDLRKTNLLDFLFVLFLKKLCPPVSDNSEFFLGNSPFWYFHMFSCAQEHTWHIGEVTKEGIQQDKVVPKIWNTVRGAMEMSRVRILNPHPSSVVGCMAAVLCCWSCLFQDSQVIQFSHGQYQCSYNLFAPKQV